MVEPAAALLLAVVTPLTSMFQVAASCLQRRWSLVPAKNISSAMARRLAACERGREAGRCTAHRHRAMPSDWWGSHMQQQARAPALHSIMHDQPGSRVSRGGSGTSRGWHTHLLAVYAVDVSPVCEVLLISRVRQRLSLRVLLLLLLLLRLRLRLLRLFLLLPLLLLQLLLLKSLLLLLQTAETAILLHWSGQGLMLLDRCCLRGSKVGLLVHSLVCHGCWGPGPLTMIGPTRNRKQASLVGQQGEGVGTGCAVEQHCLIWLCCRENPSVGVVNVEMLRQWLAEDGSISDAVGMHPIWD